MLSDKAKELFARLGMEYPAVAVKYSYSQPEKTEHVDEQLAFCQFVKKAQTEGRKFFTTKDDDSCTGKVILGMVPNDPLAASGIAGVDFGLFRTTAPNARLHNTYPTLYPGSVNFVTFCPVSMCDFDPDLVICVANTEQADIIMRATSYISGDLWESKLSCAVSCSWMYVYTYLSGRVNYCVTGMHHGMKRRKVYPAGLHIISIPYQKLDEVVTALGEMPWVLPAMREDPEGVAELQAKMDRWREMSPDFLVK